LFSSDSSPPDSSWRQKVVVQNCRNGALHFEQIHAPPGSRSVQDTDYKPGKRLEQVNVLVDRSSAAAKAGSAFVTLVGRSRCSSEFREAMAGGE
jgi:hypothetical protein